MQRSVSSMLAHLWALIRFSAAAVSIPDPTISLIAGPRACVLQGQFCHHQFQVALSFSISSYLSSLTSKGDYTAVFVLQAVVEMSSTAYSCGSDR